MLIKDGFMAKFWFLMSVMVFMQPAHYSKVAYVRPNAPKKSCA